ncbi:hypothetical protein AYL99_03460 [Fonsecaea erecta]|uniref:Extracellular membrane protein CFEM domain-containing protein n=1 Tax=Fonsecaea erecta TaxID=1367422 RepID=A0A178ZN71_9EURO|nr:hypothetical protein AYL99_03460 [Fonsecaea erecta]OAP61259.1 hypothetical protein AYL99_03460 [Fonsecaea erecta]
MAFLIHATALVAFTTAIARGQGVGLYGCQPQAVITSLTACDEFAATDSSCFANPKATAFIEECFCQQAVLNKIVDCESELRLCYLNDQFDYYATDLLSDWHSWCDKRITYTPTTPVLSTPTTTVPTDVNGFCGDYTTSCAVWAAAESACFDLDPSATAASFLSCACSTDLLSLASVCLYDVSTSCFGRSAVLTDIALFSICGTTYSNDQLITAATAPAAAGLASSASASQIPTPPSSQTVANTATAQSTQSKPVSQAVPATSTPTSGGRVIVISAGLLQAGIAITIVYLVSHLW